MDVSTDYAATAATRGTGQSSCRGPRQVVAVLALVATLALVANVAGQAPSPPANVQVLSDSQPTALGPQVTITCPAGAVNISPGTNIPSIVNAYPGGTGFCLKAGTHNLTGAITPKTGDAFVCEYGAVLDGTGWATTDTTQAAFRAHNQDIDNVTIKNCVIRKMPVSAVHAYKDFSDGWTIESNEIYGNKYGTDVGNTTTVKKNSIHHNIGDPTSATYALRGGGYAAYKATGTVFEDNEIAYNGPEQKLVGTNGVVFRRNFVHHNHTDGIWYDGDNINVLIEDNLVEDHPRIGIFYEVSGNGIVRNNTIRRSGRTGGDSGIFVSASKNVELYGNVLEENFRGITYYVDCSRVGLGLLSWDLRDNFTHDNSIRMSTQAGSLTNSLQTGTDCTTTQATAYTNGSKNLRFQGNTYDVSSLSGRWWFWGAYKTWAEWQALGNDPMSLLSQ